MSFPAPLLVGATPDRDSPPKKLTFKVALAAQVRVAICSVVFKQPARLVAPPPEADQPVLTVPSGQSVQFDTPFTQLPPFSVAYEPK